MSEQNADSVAAWHPYFNVHGDAFVVSDPARPSFTTIATVATGPEDYGRANALLLAAAPLMLDALRTIHSIAAAGFAEGGTFGDLVSIESIARSALREAVPTHIDSSGAS